jgi:hypothetical protein
MALFSLGQRTTCAESEVRSLGYLDRLDVVLCTALACASVLNAEIVELKPDVPFTEDWRKEITMPVAGGIRKGVLASKPSATIDLNDLRVSLPAETAPFERPSSVCVSLDSRDGFYHADLVYQVSGLPPGWYRLKLPTAYARDLRRYAAAELAVLAYSGRGCKGKVDFVLPISWGAQPVTSNQLTIFLNSGGDDVDVRIFNAHDDKYYACARIDTADTVAYDTSCSVTVGMARADFIVDRHIIDRQLTNVSLPIRTSPVVK